MDFAIELTPEQKRLLQACQEFHDGTNFSPRNISSAHDVPFATLRRALKRSATEQALIEASAGCGRKRRLIHEKDLIGKTTMKFHANGIPLDRECLSDLAETYIKMLPISRRRKAAFSNERPGKRWLEEFLIRHPELDLRNAVEIDEERAEAMSSRNIATHFARLSVLCNKFKITTSSQVFKLDECVFMFMVW